MALKFTICSPAKGRKKKIACPVSSIYFQISFKIDNFNKKKL